MSLQWSLSREVPESTQVVGRILVEGSIYRYLGDHFDQLLPKESVFAPMYAETGRGAVPPLLLALVSLFQFLERVPDRMAAELVVTRLDWKYACHLPLEYQGFHFTDLYAFRVRLAENEQDRLVFEEILARLVELGLVKRRGKMRTDSSYLLGVVGRLTQLELVTETLRVAVKAAQEAAPDWVQGHVPEVLVEAYEKRFWEFKLSDTEVKKRLGETAAHACWLLGQVEATAPAGVQALAEIETLRVILDQQFPAGPGGPPAEHPSGSDVLVSPHEEEARLGIKRAHGWRGYQMQVTETCDDDLPPLILDLEVTGALENDASKLGEIQRRLMEQGTPPGEQYVDQGYMSMANARDSQERGIELVGRPRADTQGPPGFQHHDFRIDEEAHSAVCPAGQQSNVWGPKQSRCGEPPGIRVRFPAQTCQACPFFGQCTKSKQGRSLSLHPYRDLLAAKRAEAETEAFRKRLHRRVGIEGAISELVRAHGLRQARYRGQRKTQLQAYFTAAAANLKRAIRWLNKHEGERPLNAQPLPALSCY